MTLFYRCMLIKPAEPQSLPEAAIGITRTGPFTATKVLAASGTRTLRQPQSGHLCQSEFDLIRCQKLISKPRLLVPRSCRSAAHATINKQSFVETASTSDSGHLTSRRRMRSLLLHEVKRDGKQLAATAPPASLERPY